MSGHNLALEPGLGKQRGNRIREMPMPERLNSFAQAQLLFGSKRSHDGSGLSYSADSPSAAPTSKKVKMNEIEMQTVETSKTLEKKNKN